MNVPSELLTAREITARDMQWALRYCWRSVHLIEVHRHDRSWLAMGRAYSDLSSGIRTLLNCAVMDELTDEQTSDLYRAALLNAYHP